MILPLLPQNLHIGIDFIFPSLKMTVRNWTRSVSCSWLKIHLPCLCWWLIMQRRDQTRQSVIRFAEGKNTHYIYHLFLRAILMLEEIEVLRNRNLKLKYARFGRGFFLVWFFGISVIGCKWAKNVGSHWFYSIFDDVLKEIGCLLNNIVLPHVTNIVILPLERCWLFGTNKVRYTY